MPELSTRFSENARKPIGVDLFCGAGGMSLGFEQAGVDVVAAVDLDPIHVKTHLENFPDCQAFTADLCSLSGEELRRRAGLGNKNIDILFGGPPCQGFSVGGRRQLDDPRNTLLLEFARLVSELTPSYFVIENVDGLLMGEAVVILEALLTRVESAGYSVVKPVKVFDAKGFGIPQTRRRVFILGYKEGYPAPEYPVPSVNAHSNKESMQPTVWDAISDLSNIETHEELLHDDVYYGELGVPSRYAEILRGDVKDEEDCSHLRVRERGLTGSGKTAHNDHIRQRFEATMPGSREPISRFYRLTAEGVSTTLRAGTDSSGGSHTAPRPIHPLYSRCITVREAARLHSLPDWFQLHPTKWHGFRQIGNSVPPLLARAVAKTIIKAAMTRAKTANIR